MVYDSFHRAALVSTSVDIAPEVGFVVPKAGIIGRQSDISTLGEFLGVMQISFAAQTDRFVFPDVCCLMKAEGGGRAVSAMRYQKPRVDNAAGLSGKTDLLSNIRLKLHRLQRLNVQRGAVIDLRQRPHYLCNGAEVVGVDFARARCNEKDKS
jgi:hypothetical protein